MKVGSRASQLPQQSAVKLNTQHFEHFFFRVVVYNKNVVDGERVEEKGRESEKNKGKSLLKIS